MAVTLQDLKDELEITWSEDDLKLQRKLDAAIDIVERYTNHSLKSKTITLTSTGRPIEFFGAPILSVSGAQRECYNDMGVTLYAKDGDVITISMGVSNIKALDEAVIRIASTLYEDGEINTMHLPIDIQLLINQFRLDDFIS